MGVKLEEFLNSVRFNSETFNFDEFKAAALGAAKQDDDGYATEIATRDTRITELDTENKSLGADNWKLSMKLGTPIPMENASGSQVDPPLSEPDPNEPELKGIESFFTPIKKE